MFATGVLPFAKRGDNRSNNLIRLQQMFPRIVAADFHNPAHISPHCQQLLKRMLTADPNQRITISEVLQHPWVQTDAAPCLQVQPLATPRCMQLHHALLQSSLTALCLLAACRATLAVYTTGSLHALRRCAAGPQRALAAAICARGPADGAGD